VQQSSFLTDSRRPAFLRAVIAAVDTAYARRVFTLDSGVNVGVNGGSFRTYADTSFTRVTAAFDTLAAFLTANRAALEARMGVESTTVARVAVRGVRPFLASLRTTVQTTSRDARDLGMANNVDALLDEMYPGKKVMLWAHNSHIRHAGLSVMPTTSAPKWDGMGAHVARRRRAELYSIGLFMYRGRAADNGRDVYSISKPALEQESMESILYHARRQYLFLDFTMQPRNEGSRWLFEPIGAFDWGTNLERMILRDQYDGVLFIHTTNPPIYIL
jgi:erythromycin esterase